MTQAQNHIVPPGSKVLVTGANGYIASHIIKVLLDLGYLVQGTVRTPMPWLTEYFEKRYGSGRFELIVVSDFQQSDAFDESVKGVSGVIHVVCFLYTRLFCQKYELTFDIPRLKAYLLALLRNPWKAQQPTL
jgi:nucleoside-diphosphate-sugar epimerase